MELFFGVITGLVILVFLVVIHELGHAIIARRNGVVVEEFGIGFPPRAYAKELKNGVLFTLNWLPLGGFVKLQGEHDAADKKGDYGAAGFWQKTKILLAGVVTNWIMAALLLTILAWTGLPRILPDQFSVAGDSKVTYLPVQVAQIAKNSPAAHAGLQVGDSIVSFAGDSVASPDALVRATEGSKGQKVEVVYTRKNVESSVLVMLNSEKTPTSGYLGVGSSQRELLKSTWSAPVVGVATTAQFTWVTLQGLGSLVADVVTGTVLQFSPNQDTRTQAQTELNSAGDSVAGPIGILGVIFPAAAQAGPTQLVFLTAIISLTLAVMNALPIPALDGGRWFVTAAFRLCRKSLTKEREEKIQTTGFLVLMLLIVLATVSDVGKFF